MSKEVTFRYLETADCNPALLDSFNRYQRVKESWRKVNDKWVLADTPFEEQWDEKKKQYVIDDFKLCMGNGDQVVGCFDDGKLIGWASVKKELFGSAKQYANLDYLHVSYEYRNRGLGKELFRQAQNIARRFGAKKIYISSQSSKETQAFYKSVGCREAEEIDPVLYEKEPFDCHLEFVL